MMLCLYCVEGNFLLTISFTLTYFAIKSFVHMMARADMVAN